MTTKPDSNKVEYLPNGRGAFVISEDGKQMAELVVGLVEDVMSVYHTGVGEAYEDMGLGRTLVDALADYARENNITLNIFCPFVKKMFQKYPQQYGDVYVHKPAFVKLE